MCDCDSHPKPGEPVRKGECLGPSTPTGPPLCPSGAGELITRGRYVVSEGARRRYGHDLLDRMNDE